MDWIKAFRIDCALLDATAAVFNVPVSGNSVIHLISNPQQSSASTSAVQPNLKIDHKALRSLSISASQQHQIKRTNWRQFENTLNPAESAQKENSKSHKLTA
ncbi:hypothetical protein [uncultured Deefgea sp.]|uniref:hypothetical protein n=1 Tax=uncultured Deefgea sp. TaxID=1304914 RepID=UPI0025995F41|nr:hypothetical protein [uncultured Deefgea sp.]